MKENAKTSNGSWLKETWAYMKAECSLTMDNFCYILVHVPKQKTFFNGWCRPEMIVGTHIVHEHSVTI